MVRGIGALLRYQLTAAKILDRFGDDRSPRGHIVLGLGSVTPLIQPAQRLQAIVVQSGSSEATTR
jgi:hypothetical protein